MDNGDLDWQSKKQSSSPKSPPSSHSPSSVITHIIIIITIITIINIITDGDLEEQSKEWETKEEQKSSRDQGGQQVDRDVAGELGFCSTFEN